MSEKEKLPTYKLTKIGGGRSYSIAVPIAAVREFGWQERQKLTVEVDLKNKRLIIQDWEK